jgi:hypothetical protein
MPKEIVYDRDTKFISNFWKSLMVSLETKLLFKKAYHPQTNGQTERVNQIVEYMLRIHVMHQSKKWEDYLPLVEFSYNNDYQESLKMSPFKALYGRKCIFSISWDSLVDKITLGLDLIKEMEKEIIRVRKKFKVV